MDKKWYIIEYEEKDYLHNKKLILRKFIDDGCDHEHCELCWNKFSNYSEDLHFGYFEPTSKSWICETCVNDFKELFRWTIEETV